VAQLKVSMVVLTTAALFFLSGCGGGDSSGGTVVTPTSVVTHIVSDPAFDGDIEQTAPGTYVVTQGMSSSVQSTFVGFDPNAGTEFRTFLDFDLTGPNGVPGNAIIDSAFLEFLVDNIDPGNGSLPVRVELVSFQPPNLIGTDFDRSLQPTLGAVLVSGDVNHADVGQFVSVDVTPLMVQAQHLGLVDFQVRVLQDLGPAIYTLIQIDDSTASDRSQRAPLLTVTYH
jgi:hypothetical protein